MQPEINMQWGDPYVIRQALTETLGRKIGLTKSFYEDMRYPDHFGKPSLIEHLKDLAFRQSGKRPKHLFITAGASGAINAALWVLKTANTDWIVTDRRFFPMYPSMADLAQMEIITTAKRQKFINLGVPESHMISLYANPSNPEGLVSPFKDVDIWDAAYASYTYTQNGHVPKSYKIMCGSLAKTFGLAGLRLGWASTDDDELAKSLGYWVTANSAGQSSVSMEIAEELIQCLDLELFEIRSSGYLDDNREEAQKILDKFGQGSVPKRGMFAILELGKLERKVLERANIKWLPGNAWGEDESWARISLGQTREVVKAAVKAVLK